jgi:cytochrome c-type biogenesis protein
MTFGALGLALVAGLLSVLSPCVLPLLPLVFGAAASESRAGPLALAAGVALSFTAVGLFVATVGFAIGLDGAAFRIAAAVLMIGVGALLLAPAAQARLATAGGPVTAWANARIDGISSRGALGQFGVGLLLGAAWSPCVGPTLGAASVLAAQGSSLGRVALTMVVFGIGAAAPLAVVGLASRQAIARWRVTLMAGGRRAKTALGVLLVALGLLIVSGLDKRVETALVDASPQWLTELTTRF